MTNTLEDSFLEGVVVEGGFPALPVELAGLFLREGYSAEVDGCLCPRFDVGAEQRVEGFGQFAGDVGVLVDVDPCEESLVELPFDG